MVFKVVLSARANEEVENILLYLYEHWNERIIDKFMSGLAKALYLIEKVPLNFPRVDFRIEVRRYSLKPYYSIFYQIVESEITIISIFDQRQDPQKLKEIFDHD
jgi:plasmid stabilization system protein ParE